MHAAPVLKILGLLLSILAVSMLIPMSFDLANGNADWQAFAAAALFSGFIGICLWLANGRIKGTDLGLKEAFLLTNGALGPDRAVWGLTVLFFHFKSVCGGCGF